MPVIDENDCEDVPEPAELDGFWHGVWYTIRPLVFLAVIIALAAAAFLISRPYVSSDVIDMSALGSPETSGEMAGLPNTDAEERPAASQPGQPAAPELTSLCADQGIINDLLDPFKSAASQVLLDLEPSIANASLDQRALAAWLIGGQFEQSTFKLVNLKEVAVDDDRAGTITVRCEASLRVVTPIEETEGAFSSYLQFNNAQYQIRIQDFDSADERTYLLAEILPVDGRFDVTSGTE